MNFAFLLLSIAVLLTSCAPENGRIEKIAEDMELWTSNDKRFGIVLIDHAPAKTEEEVRASILGVIDGIFSDQTLLYPQAMSSSSVNRLPAYKITGVSYAHNLERKYELTLVYKRDRMLMITSFAPRIENLPNPIDHFDITGEPLFESEEAIESILESLEIDLKGLQEAVSELIKIKTGKDVKLIL